MFSITQEANGPVTKKAQLTLLACLDLAMKCLERYPRDVEELELVCKDLEIGDLYSIEKDVLEMFDYKIWDFNSIDFYIAKYFELKFIAPSKLYITVDAIKNSLLMFLAWKYNKKYDAEFGAAVVIETGVFFLTWNFVKNDRPWKGDAVVEEEAKQFIAWILSLEI